MPDTTYIISFSPAKSTKRLFDLVVSAFLLVTCGPLLAAISVLVKCTSRGPVFYLQTRVGADGVPFRIVKFRTMCVGAEGNEARWTQPNDARRTRFGAVLRRMSLDELPQLWNVLKGEMSLVGPRPERPVLADEFRRRFPDYDLRHSVKGGMTGWAQVAGWRGCTSMAKRLEYDLHYVRHWSFAFDLKILWLTLRRGFRHPNAY